jgi:hypothetical protein
MYIEECLARERQAEHLKRAHDDRIANGVAKLRKMERRRERAERELLYTWQRVDQLRSRLS